MINLKLKLFLLFVILSMTLFTVSVQAYTHTIALRFGSTGPQVVALQERLGVVPRSGYFGFATRSAVVNFQRIHGLYPTGIVDYITGKILATPLSNDPYPTDCNLGLGYSPSTGFPCGGTRELSPGCTYVTLYSTTTGKPCNQSQEPTYLIEGCLSSAGYSIVNGKPCSTDIFNEELLSGEAGELDKVKRIFPNTNLGIPENYTNASFAGYTLINDNGSDLAITGIKISLKLTSGDASKNLNKYVTKISISQDGTVVGSASVGSFSKKNNIYTKAINVSNASLSKDQESNFYIQATTLKNISLGNEDNVWTVTLVGVRYKDQTGRAFIDSSTGAIGQDGSTDFHFIPVDDNDY